MQFVTEQRGLILKAQFGFTKDKYKYKIQVGSKRL